MFLETIIHKIEITLKMWTSKKGNSDISKLPYEKIRLIFKSYSATAGPVKNVEV